MKTDKVFLLCQGQLRGYLPQRVEAIKFFSFTLPHIPFIRMTETSRFLKLLIIVVSAMNIL